MMRLLTPQEKQNLHAAIPLCFYYPCYTVLMLLHKLYDSRRFHVGDNKLLQGVEKLAACPYQSKGN